MDTTNRLDLWINVYTYCWILDLLAVLGFSQTGYDGIVRILITIAEGMQMQVQIRIAIICRIVTHSHVTVNHNNDLLEIAHKREETVVHLLLARGANAFATTNEGSTVNNTPLCM